MLYCFRETYVEINPWNNLHPFAFCSLPALFMLSCVCVCVSLTMTWTEIHSECCYILFNPPILQLSLPSFSLPLVLNFNVPQLHKSFELSASVFFLGALASFCLFTFVLSWLIVLHLEEVVKCQWYKLQSIAQFLFFWFFACFVWTELWCIFL